MLELTGEIGDGVVLNLTPSELLPRVLTAVIWVAFPDEAEYEATRAAVLAAA